MSVREIVIPSQRAFFLERVELDGLVYLLDFKYNQREDAFYLEIQDETGEHLAGPMKLVSNWSILKPFRYVPGLPPGEIIAVDSTGIDTPGFGSLGTTVPLWYLDEAEVASL